MTRRPLAAVAGALAASAAPAAAATVEVRLVAGSEWRVAYDAAPGERNDVRLRALDDWTVRVHDAGAPLGAGERCRPIDAHTAECAIARDFSSPPGVSPYLYTAAVLAGDQDDRVTVEGDGLPRLLGDAGPGDDVLTGSDTGGDELAGGGGRDRLLGRGNVDVLSDGDAAGRPDADVLDGGGEADTVSYASRTADLVVDLADRGTDGERGEGDALTAVEHVVGGAGDDDIGGAPGPSWLRGGPGDDHLDGERGADLLQGEAGDDRLHGHTGADSLAGGPGVDRLRGDSGSDRFHQPAGGDAVACGTGGDAISNAQGIFVRRACELLGFEFDDDGALVVEDGSSLQVEPHPVWSPARRSLRFTLSCSRAADSDGTCGTARGRLRVATPAGFTLGRGTVAGTFGGRRELRVIVRLGPFGARHAARGGLLRVSLGGQGLPDAAWTVRARR